MDVFASLDLDIDVDDVADVDVGASAYVLLGLLWGTLGLHFGDLGLPTLGFSPGRWPRGSIL